MRPWLSLSTRHFIGHLAPEQSTPRTAWEEITYAQHIINLFLSSQWPKARGPTDVCFGFSALKLRAALVRWAVSLTNLLMRELAGFLCGHLINQTSFSHTHTLEKKLLLLLLLLLSPSNCKQPNLGHFMIKSWNTLSSPSLPIFMEAKGEKRQGTEVKYKL